MDWGFVLGLGAITLVVIGLVIYLGLKLSRAIRKQGSESAFMLDITPAGTVLYACMTAFWILCVAARVLEPESSVGAFLGRADGLTSVIVASVFFGGIAGAILNKVGYPIATKRRTDAGRDR